MQRLIKVRPPLPGSPRHSNRCHKFFTKLLHLPKQILQLGLFHALCCDLRRHPAAFALIGLGIILGQFRHLDMIDAGPHRLGRAIFQDLVVRKLSNRLFINA